MDDRRRGHRAISGAVGERSLPGAVRHALWLSWASIVWTVGASAMEIALGLTHRLLTLVVFGCAGLLDAAGSVTLVVHFRHARRHDVMAEHHEHRATLVVSCGLVVLGLTTFVEAGRRLAASSAGRASPAGTAIALASIGALSVLAGAKRSVGRRVASTALVADGWLSASGAVLAVFAVVGATLGTRRGGWWIDPSAALVVALVAAVYGTAVLWREQRRHRLARRAGADGARQ